MAFYILTLASTIAYFAAVKGTYINGRFERSYADNGFDDSGLFTGNAGILGGVEDRSLLYDSNDGSDFMLRRNIGSYIGDGVLNRGIGESLSGGMLGQGMVDPGFGVNSKYTGSIRFAGGIGGIQRGITDGIPGRRSDYGIYPRRYVTTGIAGFARRPHHVVGIGGIQGVGRRNFKMY